MEIRDRILAALSNVDDPDLKKDVVSLGMIQDLVVSGKNVSFRLVLTTPACPLKDLIKNACINAVHKLVDESLNVEIALDSRVTSHIRQEGAGQGIKNIIAVASGKGGVGKSTVATNLAIALSQTGAKTGLLDADIYGPSLPTMLGLRGAKPDATQKEERLYILPLEKFGIKAMSVGWLIDEKQALAWRGPMITSALRQLMNDVAWGELDYLVVDMPPGTGDIYITLSQQYKPAGVVIVTTPQRVALDDTRKSIEFFRNPAINIPVIGIVENMSWFSPAELPENKYHIFGKGGGEELAAAYDLSLLAQLPIVQGVAEEADQGQPAVLGSNSLLQTEFIHLAEKVAQHVSIINGKGPGAEVLI